MFRLGVIAGSFLNAPNHRAHMDMNLKANHKYAALNVLSIKFPGARTTALRYAEGDPEKSWAREGMVADELVAALAAVGVSAEKVTGWYQPDAPRERWANIWSDAKADTFAHTWVLVGDEIIIDPTASQYGGDALQVVEERDDRYIPDPTAYDDLE